MKTLLALFLVVSTFAGGKSLSIHNWCVRKYGTTQTSLKVATRRKIMKSDEIGTSLAWMERFFTAFYKYASKKSCKCNRNIKNSISKPFSDR